MVLQVRCDQRSKMLIFRYTCDKNEKRVFLNFKKIDISVYVWQKQMLDFSRQRPRMKNRHRVGGLKTYENP